MIFDRLFRRQSHDAGALLASGDAGRIELRADGERQTVPVLLRTLDDARPRILLAEIAQHVVERLPAELRPQIGQDIEFLELLFQIVALSATFEQGELVGQRITAREIGRAC